MRREKPGHTLQTTALVHEAYLRLVGTTSVDWEDRSHFFAVAATLMRRILIDYARTKKARKRGGEYVAVTLNEEIQQGHSENWDDILAVNQALNRLEEL